METTQTNNHTPLEGAKISEKWFNSVNSAMMDIYNKQLNLATSYYTNLLNPTLGSNHSLEKITNPFNTFFNNGATKNFWFPLGNDGAAFTNPFLHSFDKTYKDLLEYNRNLLTTFNTELKSNISDWSKVRQEYREFIEKQIDVSKKIAESIAESYNKQGDFSTKSYKESVEKIKKQMDTVFEQNHVFLSNLLKDPKNGDDNEVKEEKAPIIKETKKGAAALI
jgi:hypothetical protein